jgi:DNA-directed RNA polymerase specialized sigma24 family protein
VLVFHHYLGLTLPEIADRLDIPIGTAKSRLHHATNAMRAALDADSRTALDSRERPA